MSALKLPDGTYIVTEEVVAVIPITDATRPNIKARPSVHNIGKAREEDSTEYTTRIYLRNDGNAILTTGDPNEVAKEIFGHINYNLASEAKD